jgi:hypothetical protein
MPRYFFHCADGVRIPDDRGTVLPSVAAAHLEAIAFAGATLRDQPQELWNKGSWRVEVTDEAKRLLFTVITFAVEAPTPHDLPDPRPANDDPQPEIGIEWVDRGPAPNSGAGE